VCKLGVQILPAYPWSCAIALVPDVAASATPSRGDSCQDSHRHHPGAKQHPRIAHDHLGTPWTPPIHRGTMPPSTPCRRRSEPSEDLSCVASAEHAWLSVASAEQKWPSSLITREISRSITHRKSYVHITKQIIINQSEAENLRDKQIKEYDTKFEINLLGFLPNTLHDRSWFLGIKSQ
jgi:hypothetical protein